MTSVDLAHNLPTAKEWLYSLLHSGEVTRVAQHLALVLFHIADEKGCANASVRDLEKITGWGRQTIADHLGELSHYMQVTLGSGRAKSTFEMQCKISKAIADMRSVREMDAKRKFSVRKVDTKQNSVRDSVQEADAKSPSVRQPDTNASVREMDAKTQASRARIESSLREDNSTLDNNTPPPPKNADADRIAREAYELGLKIKQGVTAKSARAKQRTVGELDGSNGVKFSGGELTVMNGVRAKLSEQFPGVDLTAVCNKAAPELARNFRYPTAEDAIVVLRKWAQIQQENSRNQKTSAPRNSEQARFEAMKRL